MPRYPPFHSPSFSLVLIFNHEFPLISRILLYANHSRKFARIRALPSPLTFLPLIIILTTSCANPISLTTTSTRTILTYQDLTSGFTSRSPLNESAFAMPTDAAPPEHIFEGRLELLGEESSGLIEIISGELDHDSVAVNLPEFDFEFVQNGSDLIPVRRGLVITQHPNWNYIIEPGQVWQEPSDQDFTRASFPFALIWKGSNATFNGVMSFLFNDQGVSKVWYQITQETSLSLSLNLWGLLDAAYHPEQVDGAQEIRAAFADEKANRFPTRPIEQLAQDYPGVDLSAFGRGVSPEHMTWYGFVVAGVNYVSGCQTRFGQYAYCRSMRAPSYSTAKSMFVSLALMRLAQKYDLGVGDLLVQDYIPEAASSLGDWSAVTFDHTLDMATGNFQSAAYMQDEERFDSDPFWLNEYAAEKLAAAFARPNNALPGATWVYHTSDTFIVTQAMQSYLQTQAGEGADIFQFVVDEIYRPVQVGPGAYTTLRTRDNNWQGQPYGGYGLWWIPDDIVKITTLLQNAGRASTGEQILHPDYLAAALQANPDDRGVSIDPYRKYNNGFWAETHGASEGFECSFWVPHMLGISGNVVLLLPNGTTYYYFSDHQEFTWQDVLRQSNKIKTFCPSI